MRIEKGTRVILQHEGASVDAVVVGLYWDDTGVCYCKLIFSDPCNKKKYNNVITDLDGHISVCVNMKHRNRLVKY